jgi:hypothetical protein
MQQMLANLQLSELENNVKTVFITLVFGGE